MKHETALIDAQNKLIILQVESFDYSFNDLIAIRYGFPYKWNQLLGFAQQFCINDGDYIDYELFFQWCNFFLKQSYVILLIIIVFIMKVELSKDPLYQRKQSPLKQLKQRDRQQRKQKKLRKLSLQNRKKELEIQVIDPLPLEFSQYKEDLTYNKINQKSKATQNLKRYIISQQRNLKHVRLQHINLDPQKRQSLNNSTFTNTHEIKINFDLQKEDQKIKQINIPKIQQLFKNQIKDNLIFQNRQLSKQIDNRINAIQDSLKPIKSYSSAQDKTRSSILKKNVSNLSNIQQTDLDRLIENNLQKSKNFRLKLQNQKKLINKLQNNKQGPQKFAQLLSKLDEKKNKRQEWLQINPKPISVKQGDKEYKFTPPSMLLHELHRLSSQKEKKQLELRNLIKNSYQNRNDILIDKSLYYDQKTTFHNLSPSSQFKLRLMMDKKLAHRLELSKQQVHKFVSYLMQIKSYHTIISSKMIEILIKIRETLLGGKVMKHHDLQVILSKYDNQTLQEGKNPLIISKLKSMMI